jgi:hypothetical protein
MRRLFAWIAGAAGGLAAYRLARRRGRGAGEAAAGADARAEELRAKLAAKETETHGEAAPVEADAAPEPTHAPEPVSEPADVEARRRGVHEHGRAAIDEMRGDASAGREG